MPPKSFKANNSNSNNHDDHKSDAAHKEKSSSGHSSSGHHNHQQHHTNGKMKRVASSAGSNLRESASIGAMPTTALAQGGQPPGIQWSSFDRQVLHAYRREFRLETPTCVADPYHQLLLAQRGSIGLLSPSMARRRMVQRQSKDALATAARKHFNSRGIQETEVIAAVLHKVKNETITKRRQRPQQMPLLFELGRPYPK